MCLTIPKKVVAIKDNIITVEKPDGSRQEVKTIIDLNVGDFCVTQQNVAIEKMDIESANELYEIINERRKS